MEQPQSLDMLAMRPPRLEGGALLSPIIVRDGDPCHVTVTVAGIPIPDITWFHGSREIKNCADFRVDDKGTSCTLHVAAVTAALSARGVRVVARNRAGVETRVVDLRVYQVHSKWRPPVKSQSFCVHSSDTSAHNKLRKQRNVHSGTSMTSLGPEARPRQPSRSVSMAASWSYGNASRSTDSILDEVFCFDRKSAFAERPPVKQAAPSPPPAADPCVSRSNFRFRSSETDTRYVEVARAPPLALPEDLDIDQVFTEIGSPPPGGKVLMPAETRSACQRHEGQRDRDSKGQRLSANGQVWLSDNRSCKSLSPTRTTSTVPGGTQHAGEEVTLRSLGGQSDPQRPATEPRIRPTSAGDTEPRFRPSSGGNSEQCLRPTSGGDTEPCIRPTSGGDTEPCIRPNSGGDTEPCLRPSSGGYTEQRPRPSIGVDTEQCLRPSSGGDTELHLRPSNGGDTEPCLRPSSGGNTGAVHQRRRLLLETHFDDCSASLPSGSLKENGAGLSGTSITSEVCRSAVQGKPPRPPSSGHRKCLNQAPGLGIVKNNNKVAKACQLSKRPSTPTNSPSATRLGSSGKNRQVEIHLSVESQSHHAQFNVPSRHKLDEPQSSVDVLDKLSKTVSVRGQTKIESDRVKPERGPALPGDVCPDWRPGGQSGAPHGSVCPDWRAGGQSSAPPDDVSPDWHPGGQSGAPPGSVCPDWRAGGQSAAAPDDVSPDWHPSGQSGAPPGSVCPDWRAGGQSGAPPGSVCPDWGWASARAVPEVYSVRLCSRTPVPACQSSRTHLHEAISCVYAEAFAHFADAASTGSTPLTEKARQAASIHVYEDPCAYRSGSPLRRGPDVTDKEGTQAFTDTNTAMLGTTEGPDVLNGVNANSNNCNAPTSDGEFDHAAVTVLSEEQVKDSLSDQLDPFDSCLCCQKDHLSELNLTSNIDSSNYQSSHLTHARLTPESQDVNLVGEESSDNLVKHADLDPLESCLCCQKDASFSPSLPASRQKWLVQPGHKVPQGPLCHPPGYHDEVEPGRKVPQEPLCHPPGYHDEVEPGRKVPQEPLCHPPGYHDEVEPGRKVPQEPLCHPPGYHDSCLCCQKDLPLELLPLGFDLQPTSDDDKTNGSSTADPSAPLHQNEAKRESTKSQTLNLSNHAHIVVDNHQMHHSELSIVLGVNVASTKPNSQKSEAISRYRPMDSSHPKPQQQGSVDKPVGSKPSEMFLASNQILELKNGYINTSVAGIDSEDGSTQQKQDMSVSLKELEIKSEIEATKNVVHTKAPSVTHDIEPSAEVTSGSSSGGAHQGRSATGVDEIQSEATSAGVDSDSSDESESVTTVIRVNYDDDDDDDDVPSLSEEEVAGEKAEEVEEIEEEDQQAAEEKVEEVEEIEEEEEDNEAVGEKAEDVEEIEEEEDKEAVGEKAEEVEEIEEEEDKEGVGEKAEEVEEIEEEEEDKEAVGEKAEEVEEIEEEKEDKEAVGEKAEEIEEEDQQAAGGDMDQPTGVTVVDELAQVLVQQIMADCMVGERTQHLSITQNSRQVSHTSSPPSSEHGHHDHIEEQAELVEPMARADIEQVRGYVKEVITTAVQVVQEEERVRTAFALLHNPHADFQYDGEMEVDDLYEFGDCLLDRSLSVISEESEPPDSDVDVDFVDDDTLEVSSRSALTVDDDVKCNLTETWMEIDHPVHPSDHPRHSSDHPRHLSDHHRHPSDHPSHPSDQPSHPSDHPMHPSDHPSHSSDHPSHPSDHPSHPSDHRWHPSVHPRHLSDHPRHPSVHSMHLSIRAETLQAQEEQSSIDTTEVLGDNPDPITSEANRHSALMAQRNKITEHTAIHKPDNVHLMKICELEKNHTECDFLSQEEDRILQTASYTNKEKHLGTGLLMKEPSKSKADSEGWKDASAIAVQQNIYNTLTAIDKALCQGNVSHNAQADLATNGGPDCGMECSKSTPPFNFVTHLNPDQGHPGEVGTQGKQTPDGYMKNLQYANSGITDNTGNVNTTASDSADAPGRASSVREAAAAENSAPPRGALTRVAAEAGVRVLSLLKDHWGALLLLGFAVAAMLVISCWSGGPRT